MRATIFFIAGIVSILLINSCSDTSDTPVFLEVFVAKKDNANVDEIYAAFSDATTLKISGKMATGGRVHSTALSPDGKFVAYVADQELVDRFELFVVPVVGGVVTKVSGNLVAGGAVSPALRDIYWSPDSTLIAYIATQDSNNISEMYVSSSDGLSNVKVSGSMVAGGNVTSGEVNWSPDGIFVAYLADQETASTNEIYVSTPDGLINRKVSGALGAGFIPISTVSRISWSPNSAFISYLASQAGVTELYVSTPDGLSNNKVSGPLAIDGNVLSGTPSALLLSPPLPNSFNTIPPTNPLGQEPVVPKWAPDSSAIAYIADQDVQGDIELYASTPDGLANWQLSSGTLSAGVNLILFDFQWSPDGSSIFYVGKQNPTAFDELFVSSADGVSNVKVSKVSETLGAAAGSGQVMVAQWSPDGSMIAYGAIQDISGAAKLFVTTLSEKTNTQLSSTTPIGNIRSINWSPDGTKIDYIYAGNTEVLFTTAQLHIADVTAASSSIVTTTFSTGGTVFGVGIFPRQRTKWSSDSSRLTYLAHEGGGDSSTELFTILSGSIDKLSERLVLNGAVTKFF